MRVEPGKEYFVRGRVIGNVETRDAVFTPSRERMEKKNLLLANAIVSCVRDRCPVRMLYLGSESTVLYRDTLLGELEDLKEETERLRSIATGHNNSHDVDCEKLFSEKLGKLPAKIHFSGFHGRFQQSQVRHWPSQTCVASH